jgi:hypothetical protein
MSDAEGPDPERIDDDNPEWTCEDMAQARPAAEALPQLIGEKATEELFENAKRLREQREWDEGLAYGQARAHALGLDRMTEEQAEAYIERVIHERREKESAGKGTEIPPQ